MSFDARIDAILAQRNYPQQPQFLLAALQDAQAALGCVPEAVFARLARHFHTDSTTTERLRLLFATETAATEAMAICTGAVCRRFGLLEAMQQSGRDHITACDCLDLCDQAPAALYRGEKIPHASVELLQRRLGLD